MGNYNGNVCHLSVVGLMVMLSNGAEVAYAKPLKVHSKCSVCFGCDNHISLYYWSNVAFYCLIGFAYFFLNKQGFFLTGVTLGDFTVFLEINWFLQNVCFFI